MVETIRDVFIIVFMGVGVLAALAVLLATVAVYGGVRRVLRSARHTMENIEKVAKPLSSGSSMGFGLGSVLGFLTGIGKGGKKK